MAPSGSAAGAVGGVAGVGASGGGGEGELAVGVAGEAPAAFMQVAMMGATQDRQIGQIGAAAVGPVDEMMAVQPVGVLAAREAAAAVTPAELGLEPGGDGPGAASDPDGAAFGVVEGEAQAAVAEQTTQGSLGNRGAVPARAHPARCPLRLLADPVVRFIGLGVRARAGTAPFGIAGVGGRVVPGPVLGLPACGVTVAAVVGLGSEGGDGDVDDDFGAGPAGVGADVDEGVGAAGVERFGGGGSGVGAGVFGEGGLGRW